MASEMFFHQHITRKLLTAFMNTMNDITVEKFSWDADLQEFVPRNLYLVPVHYSTSDKLFMINQSTSAQKTFPPDNSQAPVEMQLTAPRIAVNMTGFIYDTDRHLSNKNRIAVAQGASTMYMPVPYNLELEMTSITKSLDDAFQIMEQIIPYFTPAISLNVNTYQDIIESIPVTLNSVSFDFPQDIQEAEERLYQVSYFFTIRGNYYMQKKDRSVIEHIRANIITPSGTQEIRIDAA